jgi:hypothetical protein
MIWRLSETLHVAALHATVASNLTPRSALQLNPRGPGLPFRHGHEVAAGDGSRPLGAVPGGQVSSRRSPRACLQRWQRSRSPLSADNPGEPIMQLEGLAQGHRVPALLRPAPVRRLRHGWPRPVHHLFDARASSRSASPSRSDRDAKHGAGRRGGLERGRTGHQRGRTVLAEGAPVSIVGTEHYELRNRSGLLRSAGSRHPQAVSRCSTRPARPGGDAFRARRSLRPRPRSRR